MISYDITRPCRNPRFRSWSPVFKVDTRRNIVADNKREQVLFRKREHSLRKVPAFTIQSEQRGTRPFTPLPSAQRQPQNDANEQSFLSFYEEQGFPVRLLNNGLKPGIEWLADPATFTAHQMKTFLCKFSYGLAVERQPFNHIALRAFRDLLTLENSPQAVAETLTAIVSGNPVSFHSIQVPNIRKGLDSKSFEKRVEILKVIRQLATMTGIGPLLLPFYRILLPPLRIRINTKVDVGITTTQRDRYHEEAFNTLHCLEMFGGRHAYLNIKYIIPDYQKVL